MKHVVLVVDDDSMVLEVVAEMLEDLGCVVLTAASGQEALDRLQSDDRISILITDINMPGMGARACTPSDPVSPAPSDSAAVGP